MMTIKKHLLATCAISMLLSGCANNGTGFDIQSMFGCGTVVGSIFGQVECSSDKAGQRQTLTASDVENAYKKTHNNRLPAVAVVDAYNTLITPTGAVKAGDSIKIESTIRVISGTSVPVKELKESIIAYAPSGEEFIHGEKVIGKNLQSGEFTNNFTLKLPKGAPQGIYRIKTQIILNGTPGASRTSNLQFASAQSRNTTLVASAASQY